MVALFLRIRLVSTLNIDVLGWGLSKRLSSLADVDPDQPVIFFICEVRRFAKTFSNCT
jgi:hypothetical protein